MTEMEKGRHEKVLDWLRSCPYAEFADIDSVYEDGDVYVVTASLAVEKEHTGACPITVFFEDGKSAQKIATFESEAMYMLCFPALEKWAKESGGFITESINE